MLRVAFKPTATILREQETVDEQGRTTILRPRGRHDPCVLPRAVPMVEAMMALVLADLYLRQRPAAIVMSRSVRLNCPGPARSARRAARA